MEIEWMRGTNQDQIPERTVAIFDVISRFMVHDLASIPPPGQPGYDFYDEVAGCRLVELERPP
jgi:hypothetical protein